VTEITGKYGEEKGDLPEEIAELKLIRECIERSIEKGYIRTRGKKRFNGWQPGPLSLAGKGGEGSGKERSLRGGRKKGVSMKRKIRVEGFQGGSKGRGHWGGKVLSRELIDQGKAARGGS